MSVWPVRVARVSPVAGSQILAVLSALLVARSSRPSPVVAQAADHTRAVWPVRVTSASGGTCTVVPAGFRLPDGGPGTNAARTGRAGSPGDGPESRGTG